LLNILHQERNLFLYYKLFVLVRRLILSFIQDSSHAYITLFEALPTLAAEDPFDEHENQPYR